MTGNDAGDVDTGPNELQNFPELIAALRQGNSVTVNGVLDSLPNQNYRIVLCGLDNSVAGQHGGCDSVLDAQVLVTTDGSGSAEFEITVPIGVGLDFVTATASRILTFDLHEQTSEFALNIEAIPDDRIFSDRFE